MVNGECLSQKKMRLAGLALITALILTAFLFAYDRAQASLSLDSLKLDEKLFSELEEISDELLYYDVLVVFEDGEDAVMLEELNRNYKSFEHLPIARVLLNQHEIADLSQEEEVLYIEPNREMKLFNAEGREMTNSDYVQDDLGYTGTGVEVAIIDTGTDGLHPDVQDNMAYNWQVAGTILTGDGLFVSSSPDGIDIETSIINGEAEAGVPVNTDEYGHGTHVYGTIAGSGAASDGNYRGMAPDALIHSYSASAGILLVFTVEAYDHIIGQVKSGEADIRLINNSWGSEGCDFNPNNVTSVATKAAYDAGILSVFAYGNSGPDSNTCNPHAAAPYVLGIGATDKAYNVTGFSSRGKEDGNYDREATLANLEEYLAASAEERDGWDFEEKPVGLHRPSVSAPGANIVSAQNPLHAMTLSGSFYGSASGTSMAAPMVTGVLALVIDAYEQNNDGRLTPMDLIRLAEVTADKQVMHGNDTHETGAGFIDAKEAVERAVNNEIPDQVTNGDLVAFEMPENTYSVTGSYSGTAAPNSWETNVGYETHTIEVEEGALSIYADISWALALENLYISLYSPDGDVTDVNAAAAQSAGLLDVTNSRYVEMSFPEPGTWTVRVDGRTNLTTSYTGNWEVTYAESGNEAPEAELHLSHERISGNERVDIHAVITDADGTEDITSASLSVRSANGNLLYSWSLEDFNTQDDITLELNASDLRMSGKAPWVVSLEAEDAEGSRTYEQALIGRN